LLEAEAEHGSEGRGVIWQVADDGRFIFCGHDFSFGIKYKKREPLKATLRFQKNKNTCPRDLRMRMELVQTGSRHWG
jgi:hypothetical protein